MSERLCEAETFDGCRNLAQDQPPHTGAPGHRSCIAHSLLLCSCMHLHNIAWFNFLGKDEDCSEQCGVRSGVRGIALSFIELNCTWSFIELNWEQEVEVRSVCNSASLCTASMSTVLHQCQLYCARHQCQLYSASVSTVLYKCEVKYFQVYQCATGQHCIHPWIVLHFLLLICIFTVLHCKDLSLLHIPPFLWI